MPRRKLNQKYLGVQYRGGRSKGSKNLKKTETGMLLNQHGVEFTPEEKRALENAVNVVNRKRKKMLQDTATMPRYFAGKNMGDTLGNLRLMGKESDVIIQAKTKSLQRFKSKEDYTKFMNQLQAVKSKDYVHERLKQYKRNHMKAIQDAYGDEAKDVVMKIRMMKPEEYRKIIERDEAGEIGFIYDENERHGRLNKIRGALGMKLKEDYIGVEEDFE